MRVSKITSLIEKADAFAERYFVAQDQRRKYTNEPYMVHPREVAAIVRSVSHDEAMIVAALLHDTVEDTPVTVAQIREEFGEDVAELVDWLTDPAKASDGNRAVRKAINREHSSKAPPRAQTVKLADLISNGQSILDLDPNYAKVYLAEKRALLEVMDKGDPVLYQRAWAIAQAG